MAARQGPQEPEPSDLKIGYLGLGIGIVWILVVGAFAYWLAAH
jgi:hypothetical protein